MKNKKHTDELEQMAPRLKALRDQIPPVKAPAGYYERMTEQVMQKVTETERTSYRKLPARKWMGLAAALAVALVAAWWIFSKETHAPAMAELNWDTVPTEDVQSYVLNHIDDFEWEWFLQGSATDLLPTYDLPDEAIRSYLEEEWEDENLDELEDIF